MGIVDLIKHTFAKHKDKRGERDKKCLLDKARASGAPFKESPYFCMAEPYMEYAWKTLIWPMIKDVDFSCVLDLAAGHGRNSAKLRMFAERIIVVDINEECIEACKERFGRDDKFTFIRNDGVSLPEIENESVTLAYSFDSMVHFDRDVVFEYLREVYRVLRPGGHGFFHHSNYAGNPGGDFRVSPHWRNFMSQELFTDYCEKIGLRVIASKKIGWGSGNDFYPDLDCLTLIQKAMVNRLKNL